MKHIKNPNGMALLSVLLIVSIFFIVGMALFTFSVTNAKQTTAIERDMRSVDIAEMGVVNYRNELIHAINNDLKAEIIRAIQILQSYNNQHPQLATPITGKAIIDFMDNAGTFSKSNLFQPKLASNEKVVVVTERNYYYTISDHSVNTTTSTFPSAINITFMSTGYADNKVSKIQGEYKLELEKMIDEQLIVPKNIQLITIPPFNYTPPIVQGSCTGTVTTNCTYVDGFSTNTHIHNKDLVISNSLKSTVNQTEIISSNLLVEGNLNFLNHNLIKDSTIKVTGESLIQNINIGIFHSNLFFDKLTVQSMNDGAIVKSTISTTGPAEFGYINGGIQNSNMYFGQEVSFGNLNTPGITKESTIYSEGNMTWGDIGAPIIQSKFYSGGHMSFGRINAPISNTIIHAVKNLTFNLIDRPITDSIIYVEGDLIVNKMDNINETHLSKTTICVKGTIQNDKLAAMENGINPIYSGSKNKERFEAHCPPGKVSVSFGDILPAIADTIKNGVYNYD